MVQFPRVAVREPVLRQFVLPAVVDALLEQAVLVADAVAIGRDAERRQAVHVAGGEPAEPAIAERGIGLDVAQPIEIGAEAFQRGARRLDQPQVCQRVEQQAADQEFYRQVIDAFFLCPLGLGARRAGSVDDAVAHRQRRGLVPVGVGCRFARLAKP